MPNRDLVIRIRLPRWSTARWASLVLALFLVGGGLVFANVMWTPFNNGEKLSSAKMNTNFKSLADAIDANAPKPHLVLGNTDLGLYLGQYSAQGVQSIIVWSPTVKAPFGINVVVNQLYFSGVNCTGTVYTATAQLAFQAPAPFTNVAFNSPLGTIYQLGAPLQNQVWASTNIGNGCTNMQPQVVANAVTLVDTKVPNLPVVDLTQTQLVLQ